MNLFKLMITTLLITGGIYATYVACSKSDDYTLLASQGVALVTLGAGLIDPNRHDNKD
jgi:hypothetical protein